MKKATIEQVPIPKDNSFSVENISLPHFISTWHYHSVTEIILIAEGTGTGFIGDAIIPFKPGTLCIIGEGMPHVWLNEKEYYQHDDKFIARAIVIKFKNNIMGNEFYNSPEMAPIKILLQSALHGLRFYGTAKSILANKMKNITHLYGMDAFICLLEILNIMAKTNEFYTISAQGYAAQFDSETCQKVSKVCEYIMLNFTNPISLEEIAQVAYMTPNAFCRFFKKSFLKSFKEFLIEIRLEHACKLLIDKGEQISTAAYSSGFNNLTHFNRQFKKIRGMTPKEYIKKIHAKINH